MIQRMCESGWDIMPFWLLGNTENCCRSIVTLRQQSGQKADSISAVGSRRAALRFSRGLLVGNRSPHQKYHERLQILSSVASGGDIRLHGVVGGI
jgi:hypothetical protein